MSERNPNLYNRLNDSSKDARENRDLLVAHLKVLAERINPNTIDTVVYEIAGLLSTSYARSLSENDPLEDILTLAGELEVPSEDKDEKINTLKQLIAQLDT